MPPGPRPNSNGDIFPYQTAGGANGSGDLVIHGGSRMYIGGGGSVSGGTVLGTGGSGREGVSFGAPGGGALQYPTDVTIRLHRPITPEMSGQWRWDEIAAAARSRGITFGSMQVPGVDSFYQRRSRLSGVDPVMADMNVMMVKPKYVECTIQLVKDPRRSVYSWLRDPGV